MSVSVVIIMQCPTKGAENCQFDNMDILEEKEERMKAAVVEMPTVQADVQQNMRTAQEYVQKASGEGAALIVFPEFFTTGFAFSEAIYDAIADSVDVEERMREWSRTYGIAVGGSYLWYDSESGETYNKFGLFFPTGEQYFHKKDIPTAMENFCYTAGDRERTFETPLGRIGIVMCWEQLRYDTLREMTGKVDLVIGGSCWWGFAEEDGHLLYALLARANARLAGKIPHVLAKTLGVPFIHASHASSFQGGTLRDINRKCTRKIHGDAMILDSTGNALCRAEQKAGICYAEVEPLFGKEAVRLPEDKYWVLRLPKLLEKGFYMLNEKFAQYYEQISKAEIEKRI